MGPALLWIVPLTAWWAVATWLSYSRPFPSVRSPALALTGHGLGPQGRHGSRDR